MPGVMHDRAGLRQQLTQRHKVEVPHFGWQRWGQLLRMPGQQDASPPKLPASGDGRGEYASLSSMAEPGVNTIGAEPAARKSSRPPGGRVISRCPRAEIRSARFAAANRVARERTILERGR